MSYLCPFYLAHEDQVNFALSLWGDWEAVTTQQ